MRDSSDSEYSIRVRNTAQTINDLTDKNIDALKKKFFVTNANLTADLAKDTIV